jgi:NADH-quinone oxidoreductase subunit G
MTDKCTIQVNGVDLEARAGQMLIEVTDTAGIYVPRFCYHYKLSIAANCRMCLVEVENAPKPLPACATPVTPGMKVHTKSARAIGAQKATMEFLLINHPLDCPICDQGGECELQDLAMGYGRDVSRYAERKRVVKDKNIGPLVSTDMTRCIHCTRCVRFTEEIAGYQELGTIGRGDWLEIGTYIERAVGHELSGNIIDLCPVGALNSKPFRFSARAWEMIQRPAIAPHDCLGSNLYAHVMDGRIRRVVPRPNEAINESWLSDRDRFSYEGLHATDRLERPMLRDEKGWRSVSWDEAFDAAARGLQAAGQGSDRVGALVAPTATIEEGHLLAGLMQHLGSASIDYRLRRVDFRTQSAEPAFPGLGMPVASVEQLGAALIVGSNLRQEVPLLAHRVRKAALRGAAVSFINPGRYEYLFPISEYIEADPTSLVTELGKILKAAADKTVSPAVTALLKRGGAPGDHHRRLVTILRERRPSAVLLGLISLRHPAFGELHVLAAELARLTGATLGFITEGPNSAGLALAGVLPHREAGGKPRSRVGRTAADMLTTPPRSLVLFGAEPEADFSQDATEALRSSGFVVALSPWLGESLKEVAHVVLPIAAFAETSGTFVNVEGRWQGFDAVARPSGEARPGWKVLRVLANRMGVPDCDFASSEAIRDRLQSQIGDLASVSGSSVPTLTAAASSPQASTLDVPIYRVDALVRRAPALQLAGAPGQPRTASPLRRAG